jgi:glycosyltransferase involved in cell wall biosynthesis
MSSSGKQKDKCLRVALIATDYPPVCTSAAVQMRDLAEEFVRQGHDLTVIVPSGDLVVPWVIEIRGGVKVLLLAGPQTRHASYVRRTMSELILPLIMIFRLYQSPFRAISLDLVAWYSPTIFFGPLIWFLKRTTGCRAYLILRDIFPEWALDLGLIKKGPAFWFLKAIANFQYKMADTIGVQTPSNLGYLINLNQKRWQSIEVLQNWQTPTKDMHSSILIGNTVLAGRKIFVYIGNMGIAQGMDIFIDLSARLMQRSDIGFLFVGRGSEVNRLKARVIELSISNTLFFDEVDSSEMPGLLAQCQVGLIALDPRHKTHNIPGKFLTYLIAGLPVLARINSDTDLIQIIHNNEVGRVYVGDSVEELSEIAKKLIDCPKESKDMGFRGRILAEKMFSSSSAVKQITALKSKKIL